MSDAAPRLETVDAQPKIDRLTSAMSELDLGAAYGTPFPRLFEELARRRLASAGPRSGAATSGAAQVVVGVAVAAPPVHPPDR